MTVTLALHRVMSRALAIAACAAAPVLLALSAPAAVAADTYPADLVERGRYLATASDCIACHTAHHGKPMAGGLVMGSPVGNIVSTNITPSKEFGIGSYTEQQFADAVRKGVRADGSNLYPAMPYVSYAVMTNEDVHALYAYFMQGVEPVDQTTAETRLPFPMNFRPLMKGWNFLFLKDEPHQNDPAQSPEWNRGRYLVNGPAHCSTCHTPRGIAMQERLDLNLAGAQVGPWYAPNITPDKVSGIGSWTHDELVTYLKTGRVASKAQAAGSMAEAIQYSFSQLTDEDLKAIATYTMSVPAVRDAGHADDRKNRFEQGSAGHDLPGFRGRPYADGMKGEHVGAQLFSANCASCHGASGQGTRDGYYPSLFKNSVTAGHASNLLATILYGVDRKTAEGHVFMPPFGSQPNAMNALSNEEIAHLANYVFTQHGHTDKAVTAADVQVIRDGGPQSHLVTMARVGMAVAALVVVALLAWLLRRRNRARGD